MIFVTPPASDIAQKTVEGNGNDEVQQVDMVPFSLLPCMYIAYFNLYFIFFYTKRCNSICSQISPDSPAPAREASPHHLLMQEGKSVE